jgi:hypothetical protein
MDPMSYEHAVVVRPAGLGDAAALAALNQRWRHAYRVGTLEHGFLTAPLTQAELAALVADGTVVVADVAGAVVGYYLTNDVVENDRVRERRRLLGDLVALGMLAPGRYAPQTQAAVDPSWLRRGLARTMLARLKVEVAGRFDVLASEIQKANEAAMIAHTRAGWRLVHELETSWLVITNVR